MATTVARAAELPVQPLPGLRDQEQCLVQGSGATEVEYDATAFGDLDVWDLFEVGDSHGVQVLNLVGGRGDQSRRAAGVKGLRRSAHVSWWATICRASPIRSSSTSSGTETYAPPSM